MDRADPHEFEQPTWRMPRFPLIPAAPRLREQDSPMKQWEACSALHPEFDKFDFGGGVFHGAIAAGRGEPGDDGREVFGESVNDSVRSGQVGVAGEALS